MSGGGTGGRPAGRSLLRDDAGFTVIEVVVALFVFTLVALGSLNIIVVTLRTAQQNSARSVAANLATRQIESVRTVKASSIPDGLQTYTRTVGATVFTVRQTASYVANRGSSSACDATTGTLTGKLVSVSVSWPTMGTAAAPRLDTLVAMDLGVDTVDQTTRGTLALAVRDAGGRAVPDVQVTLSPGGTTQTTGDDGCIVYPGLAVGAYSASVNTTGYVGTAAAQAVTQGSLGVLAGAISKATLYYSPAVTLDIAHDAPAGAVIPGTLPVNIGGSTMVDRTLPLCGASPTSACSSALPFGTAKELYPDQYTVWAGKCLDPAASSQASTDLRGARTGTATIPMGVITTTVTFSGVPEPNATVTLTRDPVAGCAVTESYTVSVGATGTAQLALPYGSWKVSVLPGPPGSDAQPVSLSGTTPAATLTVVDTSHL